MTASAPKETTKFNKDALYELGPQAEGMNLVADNFGKSPDYEVKKFRVYNKRGLPEGMFPTVKFDGAFLGSIGRKEDKKRGIDTMDRVVSKIGGHHLGLALGFTKAEHKDIIDMFKAVVSTITSLKDPMSQSRWYESNFPSLTDGTKVFKATAGLRDPSNFLDMEIMDDEKLAWDSPSRTWAKTLYSDLEDERWYPKVKVSLSEDSKLFLADTNSKVMPDVDEEGRVVYSKQGIDMNDRVAMIRFTESKLYTKKHWRARGFLRVTGVQLICAVVGKHSDSGNPIYGLVPKFNISVVGPLMLMESKKEDANTLSSEEQFNCMNAILFAGVKGSVGRKRRSNGASKAAKKTKSPTPPPSPKEEVIEETEGEDN